MRDYKALVITSHANNTRASIYKPDAFPVIQPTASASKGSFGTLTTSNRFINYYKVWHTNKNCNNENICPFKFNCRLHYTTLTTSQSVKALLLPPCSVTYMSKSLSFWYFRLPIKTTSNHNNNTTLISCSKLTQCIAGYFHVKHTWSIHSIFATYVNKTITGNYMNQYNINLHSARTCLTDLMTHVM